ncbi:MAG: hypothetical protein BYD32DRAFT_242221 [Podila humilis]|nr:MAG: hypothetical protein BYD32DRAFT_242221 [Podila humilis]
MLRLLPPSSFLRLFFTHLTAAHRCATTNSTNRTDAMGGTNCSSSSSLTSSTLTFASSFSPPHSPLSILRPPSSILRSTPLPPLFFLQRLN